MNQQRHPLGQHLDSCSGPDNCPEYLDLLTAPAAEKAAFITYDTARRARLCAASTRASHLRVSQYVAPNSYKMPAPIEIVRDAHGVPRPYAQKQEKR